MTVRYMIVTDELDGTTTHAVVATLDEAREVAHQLVGASGSWPRVCGAVQVAKNLRATGGIITLLDNRTITVTPVVWRARGYVRADALALALQRENQADRQIDDLPLDNGMTTR
jgi:hypothetical protein